MVKVRGAPVIFLFSAGILAYGFFIFPIYHWLWWEIM